MRSELLLLLLLSGVLLAIATTARADLEADIDAFDKRLREEYFDADATTAEIIRRAGSEDGNQFKARKTQRFRKAGTAPLLTRWLRNLLPPRKPQKNLARPLRPTADGRRTDY
jgi:hypothetical protein